MASNLVVNKDPLDNQIVLNRFRSFFKQNFKEFKEMESNDFGKKDGFNIKFHSEDCTVQFSGSWRGFEHELFIKENQYSLIEINQDIGDILCYSESNLKIILLSLEIFLNQNRPKIL